MEIGRNDRSGMKVSVRAISEATGFSPATVSNALNRKKSVNKDTAEKILNTAREMGYRMDDKIRKIHFVIFRRNGRIIDDSPFHPALIEGVERQAKAMGLETIFNHVDLRDAEFDSQIQGILSDTESAVVLLGTEMMEEDFEAFRQAEKKIVLLDGWSDAYFFDSVLVSNTDSAAKAVEYLIKKGHVKIGYIKGDFRIQAFRSRELGYRRAMEHYGLSVDERHIASVGTKVETAYAGMRQYLDQTEDLPTAFFADNDTIAIGAMRAIKEKGYQIPDDISIFGFDNISYGAVSEPPLTTIHVHKREMGEMAVRELVRVSGAEGGIKMKIQVATDFVERSSVKEIKRA